MKAMELPNFGRYQDWAHLQQNSSNLALKICLCTIWRNKVSTTSFIWHCRDIEKWRHGARWWVLGTDNSTWVMDLYNLCIVQFPISKHPLRRNSDLPLQNHVKPTACLQPKNWLRWVVRDWNSNSKKAIFRKWQEKIRTNQKIELLNIDTGYYLQEYVEGSSICLILNIYGSTQKSKPA